KLTGDDGPNWLNDPTVALSMAIGVHIWKSLPFWTLILLTGRLAISHDMYEAADVDGATWWQKFRYITWPSMQTLYITCTLLSMIWTLGDFNSVYLLTGGGPADLTHVLATLGIRYLRLDQVGMAMASIVCCLPLVLLLIGIPVLLWTLIPIYHMFLFAISPKDAAFSGQLWPEHPTLRNFEIVFGQKHHFLYNFWRQMWNSLAISCATAVLTLLVASAAAFAISRLRMKGGRLVMNMALFTYFIPAAFLAVPMYKTMGMYGLLNNDWALILAMVTIASPYAIWILRQASDKLPVELDEAALIDGASPLQLYRLVYLPLMVPSLIAVGTYALLLAWNEYLYAFLLLSNEKTLTLPVALGNFLSADDSPWELLMTAGFVYALPPAAIYYAFRRYMSSGLTAGAVKG